MDTYRVTSDPGYTRLPEGGPRRDPAQTGSGTIDALKARPGGPAANIGSRLRALPPALVATIVTFVGYLFVSAIVIGLGLLLTDVLLPGSIGRWDNGVERWFFLHRTPFWNTWTDIGSILAGAGTVVAIASVAVITLAIRRHWPEIVLLLTGLAAEIAAFLTIESTVPRPRPTIPKLDALPTTSSFPSGHVAASIVLYLGLAIVISGRIRSMSLRVLVWIVALLIPIDVAASRMYRGMHHPTDVMGGVLVGTGCLLVALLATRAATTASDLRHGRETVVDLDAPSLEEVR